LARRSWSPGKWGISLVGYETKQRYSRFEKNIHIAVRPRRAGGRRSVGDARGSVTEAEAGRILAAKLVGGAG
jgi:hypothetical protein